MRTVEQVCTGQGARDINAAVVLPPDAATRRALLPATAHGAKMQLALVDLLVRRYTRPRDLVLDALAGCGSLALAALSGRHVLLGELEPRFAALAAANAAAVRRHWACTGTVRCWQGDVRALPLPDGCVDAVLTSPPYGSLARRQRAAEPSTALRANTPEWVRTRHDPGFHVDGYGQAPGQIGCLDGPAYAEAMAAVYRESARVLKPGGLLVVVTCDYWRGGQRVRLAEMTAALCAAAGLVCVEAWQRDRSCSLGAWQRVRQRRGLPVVTMEDIQCFHR